MVDLILKENAITRRNQLESQYGCRYSALLDLPYCYGMLALHVEEGALTEADEVEENSIEFGTDKDTHRLTRPIFYSTGVNTTSGAWPWPYGYSEHVTQFMFL